jgi:two-component sensor histidine kinase
MAGDRAFSAEPRKLRARALRHTSTRLYLFGLVTAVLIPLLAFTAFLLTRYAANERARFENEALETAHQIALIVDGQVGMLAAMLQGLASSASLAGNDLMAFHREAVRLVQGRDAIIVLRELGPSQLLNTERPFGDELPPAVPISPADTAKFKAGNSVISGVYASPLSGEPRIAVALPVTAGEASPTLVLAITVPTARVRNALMPAVPRGWIGTVADQNGIIVARSARHEEVSGKPVRPEYLASATGSAGTLVVTGIEGIRVLSGYYRSEFSGWLVGANIPEATVEAPLWQSLLALGLAGAAAIALSALLAYLFGTTFTAAAEGLARRAAALGAGQPVVPMSSPLAELERVGDALANAALAIEQRERERQLLVNELDHRVKNALAVVHSIVHQTLRAETSDSVAREAIAGRLMALAQTHDVLTRESWQGAELHELITETLRPYGDRVRSQGPHVSLPTRLSVSLALALHELATNAAKYGSLSSATGMVEIAWQVVSAPPGRRLVVRWTESGGPTVKPPTRQGFGTRLLQRGLSAEISGTVSVEYKPEGLVCVIDAVLE